MEVQRVVPVLALVFGAFACSVAGTCTIGDDAKCPEDTVCWGGEGAKVGSDGICTEGALTPEGRLQVIVKGWKLLTEPTGEVAPLLWDKAEEEGGAGLENAGAGWVGMGGAAVEVELVGLKAEGALSVETGGGEQAKCGFGGAVGSGRGKRWACVFGKGWALAEPEAGRVEVKLRVGEEEAVERTRTYRVDGQTPLLSLTVSAERGCEDRPCPVGQSCLGMVGSAQRFCMIPSIGKEPGEISIRLCAQAKDLQSGLAGELQTPSTPIASTYASFNPSGQLQTAWVYEGARDVATRCWTGSVPAENIGGLYFGIEAQVGDKAGNVFSGMVYGSFERLLCDAQAKGLGVDAVKAPLAFSRGHVLFATAKGAGGGVENNTLYFWDAEGCREDVGLHTGAIEGPMVVLGDSGRIALGAGGGGPEGREGPHLSLVEGVGVKLSFVRESDWDCIPGREGLPGGGVFNKGLSLVGTGNADGTDGVDAWRFAAPANSQEAKASRLVAYVPNATWPDGRCITKEIDNKAIAERFALTPVQFLTANDGNYGLLTAHETDSAPVAFWGLCDTPGCLYWLQWKTWAAAAPAAPSGAAVGEAMVCNGVAHELLWLSGAGLRLLDACHDASTVVVGARTSPAVVDGQGRAYVVVSTGLGYELQRFSTKCGAGGNSCQVGEQCIGAGGEEGYCRLSSLPFEAAPVGSPLLGQAGNTGPSEIYVVDVRGGVRALDIETLEPLWVQNLGIGIWPTAQPILVRNTHGGGSLWAVGANGEIRGIRVAGEGLSHTALWPKAFHDNCNTSSSAVKPADMPSCF